MKFLTADELEQGLVVIRQSPRERGVVEMIVRRLGRGEREVLAEGRLDVSEGLTGDDWKARGSTSTPDGSANPDAQLTLMNSRLTGLIAQHRERWPLAGDQFYVDFDLSAENLPPGKRLAIGSAVVEITALPHTGCSQFRDRFGLDALKFVSSPTGRQLNLRGIYARVIEPGVVRTGDLILKL